MDYYSESEIMDGGTTPLKVLNEIIATFDKVMEDCFHIIVDIWNT